jgi:hypothetical protein
MKLTTFSALGFDRYADDASGDFPSGDEQGGALGASDRAD